MADWITECFDWFDARFLAPPAPILPTSAFFRAGSGQDHTTAVAVLADVKRLLRYGLPIDLVPLTRPPGEYRHSYQSLGEVGGTYQETDQGRVISYDPETVARPLAFINTLAHEVMHARLSGLTDQVPGGEEAHELATDLGCIIAGFGVFQLQAADDTGWSGYMSQDSRAFALAVFLDQRGLGADAANAYLSRRCQRYLKRGFADLHRLG
ncbi:MAG: hypothetical protein AAFW64_00325 [Pseudomonadota bacterium]